MEYTSFKAGDKVSWDGIKAMVVEDSDADHDEVKVYVQGKTETWVKVYNPYPDFEESQPIPVVLDENA